MLTSGNMEVNTASIAMTAELFKLLSSGVYENKIAAIIREIICNGRDAQMDAGTTDTPIVMHLPNQLEPWWSVRDFGTGLAKDKVMNLYVTYGMSTKGASNDFIGAMGIGSKSPLAYTDSFMVTSWFEGEKTTFNIFMDKGIPQIACMGSQPSDEPTGFQVTMQVRDNDFRDFKYEAEKFLKVFNKQVEVVGQTIENTSIISDYVGYRTITNYDTGVFAVMGGVAYRLPNDTKSRITHGNLHQTILLDFEIGDLSVTGSRETLSLDDKTKLKVDTKVKEVSALIEKDIQAEFDLCTDVIEIIKLAKQKYNFNPHYSYDKMLSFVKIGGKSLNEVYKGIQDDYPTRTRQIRTKGSHHWSDRVGVTEIGILSGYTSRHEAKYVLLVPTRKTGMIKLARAISEKEQCLVLIADSVEKESYEKLVELFKLPVYDAASVYETYVPKVAKIPTTYRKTTGLFKYDGLSSSWKEVTELPEDTKGYFLETFRNSVDISSKDGRTFTLDWNQYTELVDSGLLKELYFVRNVGMKQLKGISGMEKLLIDTIEDLVSKKFNKRLRSRIAQAGIITNAVNLKQVWHHETILDLLKDDYPIICGELYNSYSSKHLDKYLIARKNYLGLSVLFSNLRLTMKPLPAKLEKLTEKADKELEVFKTNYPLLTSINPRLASEPLIVNEIAFYIKEKKEKILKQVLTVS